MPTRGIYIEKKTFEILEAYASENSLSLSKAINKIVQASTNQAPQQPKQAQQKRDVSASKEQKVSTPQQKKKSHVKDFDSWYASASPQQRKHYFETGRMS